MKEKPPTFGVLHLEKARTPSFLKTLADWGSLPEYISLTELAALLATLCSQNPAALLVLLGDAVWNEEVAFAGLSHEGHWEPGMQRVLSRPTQKPRLRTTTDGQTHFTVVLPLPERAALHYDAVGMKPSEAVHLLQRRGRKVPAELLAIIPSVEAPPVRKAGNEDAGNLSPQMSEADIVTARQMYAKDRNVSAIAKKLGRSRKTIDKYVKG